MEIYTYKYALVIAIYRALISPDNARELTVVRN